MKTLMKNIAASMILMGTVAVTSAYAQVEGQDQQQMETEDPTQTQDQEQGQDPALDQQTDPTMQEDPTLDQQGQTEDQKQREEIEITEVPSAVSEQLNSGEYQDMQPTRAYRVTDPASGEVHYEVEFTNAQGTTESKKFDEQGEEVKKDKKDKNKSDY